MPDKRKRTRKEPRVANKERRRTGTMAEMMGQCDCAEMMQHMAALCGEAPDEEEEAQPAKT